MHSFVRLMVILALPVFLYGCSEMQFATPTVNNEEHDPREDMWLTGVVTDMTSAGLVQNRIVSDVAVYSEVQSRLTFQDVEVHSFGEEGTEKGVTSATTGTVYLANQKVRRNNKMVDRHKDDLEFVGNVTYRALKKDDPTTDTMRLTTEELLWAENEQRFRTDAYYQMVMFRPGGGPPMVSMGDGFTATQDMRNWNVRYGAISTDGNPNARENGERLRQLIKTEVDLREKSMKPPVEQKAIEVVLPELEGSQTPAPNTPIAVPPAIDAAANQTPSGKIEIPEEMKRAEEQVVGGRKTYRLSIPAPQAPAGATAPAPTVRRTPLPTKTPVSADVEQAMQPGRSR